MVHPDQDRDECSFNALRRAAAVLGKLYDKALEPIGLSAAQYNLLSHLKRASSLNESELAAEFWMDRLALKQALDSLVRDGWIIMLNDGNASIDHRFKLSDTGLVRLQTATELWRKAQDRLYALLGDDVSKNLRELFELLTSRNFSDEFWKQQNSCKPIGGT